MSTLVRAYLLVLCCLELFIEVESVSQSQFFRDRGITSASKHESRRKSLRYNVRQSNSRIGLGDPLVTDIRTDMYIGSGMRKYLQVRAIDNVGPSSSPEPSPSSISHLCDTHGLCGAYGVCNASNSQVCECLQGFRPKSPQEWSSMNWSQGCVRDRALNCDDKYGDSFISLFHVNLPDGTQSLVDQSIGLQECRQNCINNCSCTAYTILTNNVTGGDGALFPYGCAMWSVDLINIKQLSSGQNLFVRIAASKLGNNQGKGQSKKIAAIVSATVAATAIALVGCYYFKFKRRKLKRGLQTSNVKEQNRHMEDLDLPLFDLETIITATNDFSMSNKLGEGGFGPVYWGKLDGQEIAVKRLSQSSGQGLTEFKNEVKLIAKVQHRNLVRLLGCCIQEEEKMLVYEYMPNKSLDSFLFDETRRKLLDWPKRFQIIIGVARGLLYLHEESRLRIIHRDLKASNVLLDSQLNPKISDFGMARTFGGDQTEGNTRRIVGTFGYMAPEYAIDGQFSVKSDVFSFGILLLEIVTGKRNKGFYNPNHFQNLISQAWKLRKEGRALEMVDPILQEDSCNLADVLRCIHVSLLCLQRHPEERPSMSSVVLMLGSDVDLSEPKQPGFLVERNPSEAESSSSKQKTSSANEITLSLIEAR